MTDTTPAAAAVPATISADKHANDTAPTADTVAEFHPLAGSPPPHASAATNDTAAASHPVSASSPNGFAASHSHTHHPHPPNLQLQGISHKQQFETQSQLQSAAGDSDASLNQSSYSSVPNDLTISVDPMSSPNHVTPTPSPLPESTIGQSPSLNSLVSATLGSQSLPSSPSTPGTATGYTATNLAPSAVTASPPSSPQPHPAADPAHPQHVQYQAMMHAQYQQRVAQQQQSQTQQQKSSGFFSSLFNNSKTAGAINTPPRPPQPTVPPLVLYMNGLRATHQRHLKNINALQDMKKNSEKKSSEEIAQWNAWSNPQLAQLGANYYHTQIHYIDTVMSLEGRYMANIERHIMVANEVVSNRYSERMIEKEMFSTNSNPPTVRTPDEIEALFWPPDAEECKAQCRTLGEQLKRIEFVYLDMAAKAKKRDSAADRTRKLGELIQRGHQHRDSLEVDTFHHHPNEPKFQSLFNNLLLDQRGEEGKIIKQFFDFQSNAPNRARMAPFNISSFINQLLKLVLKNYKFDERFVPILRVYVDRLIFPRIPELLQTIVNNEEREKKEKEKSQRVATRLSWLRSLTPDQLGMTEDLIPPGYQHASYTPLLTPPGAVAQTLETIAEEKPATDTPAPMPASASFNEDNPLAPPPAAAQPAPPARSSQFAPPPAVHAPATANNNPTPATAQSIVPLISQLGDLSFLTRDDAPPALVKMVSDDFPYATAINCLSQLNVELVPFDLFFRVVQAVRQVNVLAKQYMRANRQARAKAQSRALTKDDPFSSFMTKLVQESAQETKKLQEDEVTKKQENATVPNTDTAAAATAANGQLAAHPLADSQAHAAQMAAADAVLAAHYSSPSTVPPIPAAAAPLAVREEEEIPLNADDLFPLMTWLVIHANVPNLYILMGQIDRFIPPDLKNFGEAGYCVSQVEAVMFYLEQLTPETLGRPQRSEFVEEEEAEERARQERLMQQRNNSQKLSLDTRGHSAANADLFDAVSSPAQILASPSVNLISPGVGPSSARPSHSASLNNLSQSSRAATDPFAQLAASALPTIANNANSSAP